MTNTTTIVAVTPTLSDAVQSAGATLHRHAADGHPVVVVSVFSRDGEPRTTRAPPKPSASPASSTSRLTRRRRAATRMTARTTACGLATTRPKVAASVLALALGRLEPDLILAPLGLTGHVDHLVVQQALDELELPRLRWLDLPYALRRTAGAPLGAGEVVAVPASEPHLAAKLDAAAAYGAETDRLAAHAVSEGQRLGAGGPVEILVQRPATDI